MNQEVFGLTFNEELYRIPPPMTVVLTKAWTQVTEAEQVLLSKILGSVRQNLNSVAVVEMNTVSVAEFSPGSRVLAFGAEFSPAMTSYQAHHAEGSVFIRADELALLEPDAAKKKELWNAMKLAFL